MLPILPFILKTFHNSFPGCIQLQLSTLGHLFFSTCLFFFCIFILPFELHLFSMCPNYLNLLLSCWSLINSALSCFVLPKLLKYLISSLNSTCFYVFVDLANSHSQVDKSLVLHTTFSTCLNKHSTKDIPYLSASICKS